MQACRLYPQPGSTYYLRTTMFLEIMDPIYRQFIETVGPKNADHMNSYIVYFLSTLPAWIERIPLFLDNALSITKTSITWAGL